MPLTPRQQRFIIEYLVDLNGTRAYFRAGYRPRNDSVARANAARLLAKATIAAARAAQEGRTKVTADKVLCSLWEEARREGEDASHSARVKELELLGKHLGLFPDRVSVTGQVATVVRRYVGIDPDRV